MSMLREFDVGESGVREAYEEHGFVVIRCGLGDATTRALQDAAERVTQRTRCGEWEYRRTSGAQWPHEWDQSGAVCDVWGAQHLLHPDLGEPSFGEWYGCDANVITVATLLGLECASPRPDGLEGDAAMEWQRKTAERCRRNLSMELVNMLINPTERDYELTWHRDTIKVTASIEEQEQQLALQTSSIQWNHALYDDGCFWVVPATHKRALNAQEQAALERNDRGDVPGAVQVLLREGTALFYNHNLLHRGVYDHRVKRATLHASLGAAAHNMGYREGNLEDHRVEWLLRNGVRESMHRDAVPLYDNYRRMLNI